MINPVLNKSSVSTDVRSRTLGANGVFPEGTGAKGQGLSKQSITRCHSACGRDKIIMEFTYPVNSGCMHFQPELKWCTPSQVPNSCAAKEVHKVLVHAHHHILDIQTWKTRHKGYHTTAHRNHHATDSAFMEMCLTAQLQYAPPHMMISRQLHFPAFGAWTYDLSMTRSQFFFSCLGSRGEG